MNKETRMGERNGEGRVGGGGGQGRKPDKIRLASVDFGAVVGAVITTSGALVQCVHRQCENSARWDSRYKKIYSSFLRRRVWQTWNVYVKHTDGICFCLVPSFAISNSDLTSLFFEAARHVVAGFWPTSLTSSINNRHFIGERMRLSVIESFIDRSCIVTGTYFFAATLHPLPRRILFFLFPLPPVLLPFPSRHSTHAARAATLLAQTQS